VLGGTGGSRRTAGDPKKFGGAWKLRSGGAFNGIRTKISPRGSQLAGEGMGPIRASLDWGLYLGCGESSAYAGAYGKGAR